MVSDNQPLPLNQRHDQNTEEEKKGAYWGGVAKIGQIK